MQFLLFYISLYLYLYLIEETLSRNRNRGIIFTKCRARREMCL